ncbi:DUF4892 domain-containing protein [Atopomonas sediminilitoris]|uniref:DUF4892 domain-containing protein n=1 Tax=Atopomonas sediminilitoris TaxID=2919919 RepID=UPI001F4EC776|nr:DUF4892 domain-containing protein [Atopomonas sediminilitoris]MCJ8167763.1 DUF4892 domain-containing protein [Atopomonas sediminilitoris]
MRAIVGLVVALLALPLAAQEPSVAGFEPFPRAVVRAAQAPQEVDYTLYLSAPQRISGQLRADRVVQRVGRLQRISWQIPSEHSAKEAFLQAKQQWRAQGYSLLYACRGRRCGSSNLIANSVLDNAKLYGPDDGQMMAVLRGKLDDRERVVVLYGITRGNRRVYLHMDEFFPAQSLDVQAPESGTLLLQLNEEDQVSLPDWPAKPEQPWLNALQQVLRRDFVLRLALSGPSAAAWHEALLAAGVPSSRVSLDPQAADVLTLQRVDR